MKDWIPYTQKIQKSKYQRRSNNSSGW